MFHEHGGNIYTCPAEREFRAPDGQKAGAHGGIADFSANINFRGMPEKVRQAARRASEESVHYPDPECRVLREALAKRETVLQRESKCEPALQEAECEPALRGSSAEAIRSSQIICGNGAAELIFALAAAYRPKRALLAVPSFFEYEQALAAFGCELRRFCLRPEQDFRLDASFLDALNEETDCVVLGNPNNPTGRLIDREILERLITRCGEQKILLVLDESFYDFLCEDDRRRTFSGSQVVPRNREIFVLRSFTKIYGMPGLRFGYGICGDAALLERMRMVLQPWNVSLPAQAAAAQAARELDFAEETARLNRENRERLASRLENAGYRVFPSEANFLLFQGPEDLKEFCMRRGFLIRDCSNFPGLGRGFFRVCVRSDEENNALVKLLSEVRKR